MSIYNKKIFGKWTIKYCVDPNPVQCDVKRSVKGFGISTWESICTCYNTNDGKTALQNARKIARLLNKENKKCI